MFGRMNFKGRLNSKLPVDGLLATLCLLMLTACTKENVESLQAEKTLGCNSAKEISYATDIAPILQANCGSQAGCHSNGAASGGVKLEDYNGIKEVAATGLLKKAIFHEAGVSPMPKNLTKLDDCTLSIINKWLEAGYPNN